MTKFDELKDEITKLEKLMETTWTDICKKKKELKSICTHNQLECNKAIGWFPGYENGLYSYICLECKEVFISDGKNPELEKKVVRRCKMKKLDI